MLSTWFAQRGVIIERVLSDNGGAYRSYLWRDTCETLSIRPKRTRPYRPQTNGKVERFHRTVADGWAYARCYQSETERREALEAWLHHYNHHRPHTACANEPPFSRLVNVPGQYTWRRAMEACHRRRLPRRDSRHETVVVPEMTSGWEAALAGASSHCWTQRVRAGRDLASFADVPDAADVLVRLLLDVEDTAVTRHTAEALARVGTVAAVRLIALTVAEADDNQADWLRTGVHDALAGPDGGPDVAVACGKLARDPEEVVRRGAAEISAWTDDARC